MSNLPAVINERMDFDTVQRVSMAMSKSGYFKDASEVAQAIVKVMAGQEMGIQPFAAMSGIHIINGKPELGANLIASLIKNDSRYDYRIAQLDDSGCEITFFENGQEIGRSSFSREDANRAQLKSGNWQKFPRNMFFARAISNGAKWYVPGVFGGAPVYVPDEMGADVDEEGDIIEGELAQAGYGSDTTPQPGDIGQPDDEPTPDPSSNGQERADEINDELGISNSSKAEPVDWRAKLTQGRPKLSSVMSAAANGIPTVNSDEHALAILQKHFNIPDEWTANGFSWSPTQPVKQETAVMLYDAIAKHESEKADQEAG